MTDIERLLEWLARGSAAETRVWPGCVMFDSVTAVRRLIDHVFGRTTDADLHAKNHKWRMLMALRRVSDLRDLMAEEHEGWLRGGVHPSGTRARERADAARYALRARRNRSMNRILLAIVRRCARHYGWAEPISFSLHRTNVRLEN